VLIPATHLRQLELDGHLRWLIPFGAGLANGKPPPAGAVFEIEAPSGAVFTCRLEARDGEAIELQYVGPERPNLVTLELARIVGVPGA